MRQANSTGFTFKEKLVARVREGGRSLARRKGGSRKKELDHLSSRTGLNKGCEGAA